MEEGKDGLRSVILLLGAVLVLGSLLLPQAQADQTAAAKFCCKNQIGSHCYTACTRNVGDVAYCAEMCCCVQLTSGSCPRQCPTPASNLFLANSSTSSLVTTSNAAESCKLRCSSMVCNSMRDVIDGGSEVMKAAVERCGDACGRFCAGAGAGGVASLDAYY